MREIQLPLNQTQKLRLQRALEQLESLSSDANSNASVIVADTIPVNCQDGVLKGHRTTDINGELIATVYGVVERVNKLVYVRVLRARYKPEIGDIIVGRVIEVAAKSWRLEINFSQDAVLMLSSMNLPDGIPRRRTAVDELNMRSIFEENDVVCAEGHGFQHDGSLHLQAGSQKFRVHQSDRKMRRIQLPLNQTQKLRLQRALEQLESLSSDAISNASITVTDTIPVNYQDGVLKGHGTNDLDGELMTTVCRVVERVNKLVYVRALRARYKPEIGDIIAGRVIEVAAKSWRLEINFSQDAVLMLSSMNLPDGIPRRRTAVDELNMRSIFEENDVVCAEGRGFQYDGSLHLQARSQKYRKLERGQLLTVPPYLVKRRKQHFHYLEEYRIDLIIGCNGFIWVGEHIEPKDCNNPKLRHY